MVSVEKVINPKTGRWITVGSSLYNKLKKDGIIFNVKKQSKKASKRSKDRITSHQEKLIRKLPLDTKVKRYSSSQSKGWSKDNPKRGKQRNKLMEICGKQCFLIPDDKAFPICKVVDKSSDCKLDCRAVGAAKSRAGEWKYNKILKFSKDLYDEKCQLKENNNCLGYKKKDNECDKKINCKWVVKKGCLPIKTNKVNNKCKGKRKKNNECEKILGCKWIPRKGCI